MSKIKIIIGTYNSQPVGTYDYIFEQAYQEAYKPYLTVFYNFSQIPVTLFYSGTLLTWLEDHHPEFLMLLNDMVKQKRVELLSGGFYDPVFSITPTSDRIGQIEKLTTYLRKQFGKRPRGAWISELAWEPSLTSMFNTSGINYVFLDEKHFQYAGFKPSQLYYPCITEDQGKTLLVFPITTSICNKLPNRDPQRVFENILSLGDENEERYIVLLDAGEKYGLYNESNQHCYKERWIEQFLALIDKHSDAVEVTTPGAYSKNLSPTRRGYFSCTSSFEIISRFDELNGCSENNRREDNFGCNTFFRQFLSTYEESNLLYSKMVYSNILVNQIRGDKYRKKAAREELWRGQCNYVYWHGNHAGLYDSHLRKEAYRALIEAEKLTHEKGMFIPSIIKTDFDFDGQTEYLYQGNDINVYLHNNGGIVFELDYLPVSWNYLDTIRRYQETSHTRTAKHVLCDWYARKSFVDHFFRKADGIEHFYNLLHRELGDFIGAYYDVKHINREHNEVLLERTGIVTEDDECAGGEIILRKRYIFHPNHIDVGYTIINNSPGQFSVIFGCEMNLSFSSFGTDSHNIYSVRENEKKEIGNDICSTDNVEKVWIKDVENDVTITFSSSRAFQLWSLPITTDIFHHDSIETFYQSTCFVPRWSVSLGEKEQWDTWMNLTFEQE